MNSTANRFLIKATRLLQFIEAGVLDLARFQAIIARHGLQGAWQRFETQFLGDNP